MCGPGNELSSFVSWFTKATVKEKKANLSVMI